MGKSEKFEQIRNDYFINPKTGDDIGMAQGLKDGIEALAANKILDESVDDSINPTLGPIVREMIDDFSNARRFDHLSVAQIHPSGNVPAMLAHNFSTFMNNNTIVEEVSPVEVPYERKSIAWRL